MLQIIGKGGMAREVHCYRRHSRMAEYEEIDRFDLNSSTVIAIGDPSVRLKIFQKYPNFNYTSIFYGHLHDDLIAGDGCILCPGSRITTNVKLGNHVIVNNNATIAHDCVIGDFCTISPGAALSGNVTLGRLCYVGSNAVIREKTTICDDVFIGCGSVVVKDIKEPGIYIGNPAKKIKDAD